MAEESTTPDLVQLARRSVEAGSRRDLDAAMALYKPDAVWDASPMGIGTFEGQAAIRGFWEDWLSSYEDYELQMVEAQDLGNGVTWGVLLQRGRLVGSSGEIELRYAAVSEWQDGKIARTTNYTDIDEARAAAERLAAGRGMAEECTTPDLGELARRFIEVMNERDFDSIPSFYARDAVLNSMGMGASFEGVAAIRGYFEDFTSPYEELEAEPEELLDLGNGVMLSVVLQQGRLVGSSARVQMRFATVAIFVDGAVVRQTLYTDVDEARADAERLAQERA